MQNPSAAWSSSAPGLLQLYARQASYRTQAHLVGLKAGFADVVELLINLLSASDALQNLHRRRRKPFSSQLS